MAGWFDELAKKSAAPSVMTTISQRELSRRSVITKGVVVAGAAWAAPTLLGARPAFAGLSTCSVAQLCVGTSVTLCCPTGTTCGIASGIPSCIPDGQLGGSCGNQGQGICDHPYKCNGNTNQCNECARPNICGGEGSQCCTNAECFDGGHALVCTAQGAARFCRKVCTGAGDCTAGQSCVGGICAEPCTKDSQCLGTAACGSAGYCEYQVDGGVSCPP